MTQDEIRKLLGGYATDALTADERRILFEAALEDQELFNALENEDALRELLDDPVSRDQVRRALAGQIASKRRPGFWSRRWLLGVAIPTVAAVILIIVMDRANAPRLIAPPVEVASDQVASSQTAAAPKPAPRAMKLEPKASVKAKVLGQVASSRTAAAPQLAAPAAAPESVAPAAARPLLAVPAPTAQLEATRPAMASFRAAGPAPIPEAVRQQFSAGFPANAPLYQGPLVQYSVARGRQDGNAVRINVSTAVPGYLALYRIDAAGNAKRVYPTADVATPVLPNIAMQIPINPVKVGAGETLRLVVVPAVPPETIGQLGGALNGAVSGTGAAPFPQPAKPLVIDIPLVPN